jgi:hypothetical protein
VRERWTLYSRQGLDHSGVSDGARGLLRRFYTLHAEHPAAYDKGQMTLSLSNNYAERLSYLFGKSLALKSAWRLRLTYLLCGAICFEKPWHFRAPW